MTDAIVVTLAGANAQAVIDNHASYCIQHRYRHVVVDIGNLPDDLHLRCNYKLHTALRWLVECAPDSILAVLTGDVVIFSPQLSLLELMCDRVVLVGSDLDGAGIGEIMLWRSCEEGARRLLTCVNAAALGHHLSERGGESSVLTDLEPVPWHTKIAGHYFAMPALHYVDPIWMKQATFAAVIGPLRTGKAGAISPLLRDAIAQLAQRRQEALNCDFLLDESAYVVPSDSFSVINPHQSIAFVMLYTPNISMYGRIGETRLREYAEASGYTAYIYRELPAGLAQDVTGNWAKPWVLQKHLSDHEWLFWVDADILIQSCEFGLEPLLKDRSNLLTWDVGGWRMNSGLFALKNIPESHALLERVIADTIAVNDKSGVYRSGGDQPLWIAALEDAGYLHDGGLVDVLRLNTPWYFQQDDSFMVHYFELWNEVRALLMDAAYRRTRSRF